MNYKDIQLTDKELWAQFQSLYQSGDYVNALTLLQNSQLSGKSLIADALNATTDYLVQVENLNDPNFKADRPIVQSSQPTQSTGQLWFQVTN